MAVARGTGKFKERMETKLRRLLAGLLLIFSFSAHAGEVEDVSDRAYRGRVESLLDQARETIDVSLFTINLRPVPEDPAYRLVEALVRAASRGVRVRLWLNSRGASVGSSRIFMRSDLQEELTKKGIKIFYVDSSRRLHDKLIVIDRRIVVEGSMNWTREALLKNFESASVIRSPELAGIKIKRLEAFPLLSAPFETPAPETPGEIFPFPLDLLENPEIFPASLENQEARTLALYLLFQEEAHRTGEKSFSISLEGWGARLPFKRRWIGPSLRFEMRRTLDLLEKRYGLIEWEKISTKEARVALKPVSSSDEIWVPLRFVESGYVKSLSPNGLFTYLIVLHKAQISGNVPFWLGSINDVAEEFHLSPVTLIRGLWELKRANLIEIFPSEKKLVEGRWERQFANRYLLNPILIPSERSARLEGLEKRYGTPLVRKAGELSDSLDEPEDLEVILELIRFLKRYPAEEVEEATRTVARFNRNNALRTPAYVRGILEAHETG